MGTALGHPEISYTRSGTWPGDFCYSGYLSRGASIFMLYTGHVPHGPGLFMLYTGHV